jgi:hypothetical protein
MRSIGSLRHWMVWLLPDASEAAREGAWQLVRALMDDFTVCLSGLARQLERGSTAAGKRQYLSRWLGRKRWDPVDVYARLPQLWPRELLRANVVPLLIDCTILGQAWTVVQFSLPWQRRALPIYRVVVSYRLPEQGQTELVLQALTWLRGHLPGPASRYVAVMDRGFPSHSMIRTLQENGWRYVLRIGSNWRMTHSENAGILSHVIRGETEGQRHLRWYGEAVLGQRGKGHDEWSRTHVVTYWEPQNKDSWVLATSEGTGAGAVAIYRQRMQIEAEFKDLKGPLGLDHLEKWKDRQRVARMLAWIAVYEWRLALLWLRGQLADWGKRHLQIGGPLSWITITRAWVHQNLERAASLQTPVRESP